MKLKHFIVEFDGVVYVVAAESQAVVADALKQKGFKAKVRAAKRSEVVAVFAVGVQAL